MKILYVSQYYPPEGSAPAARVSELARHWVTEGHSVTVLTGFPNHPTGVIHPAYRKRFRRLFSREQDQGIDVVRTWLLPLPNRKSTERILNYSSFFVSAVLRGLFVGRPDVLIATSPQLLVGVAGWILARVKRVPFVFEVRDIWPDAILASGVSQKGSFLDRALSAISRFLYRRADLIVPVTPAFIEDLATNWGVPRGKMRLVQNGVETEVFAPDVAPDPELKTDDRFIVSYIGTVGFAHGLGTVISAAEQIRDRLPAVHFVIVGDGADMERLRSEIDERGLSNVELLGRRPREDIPGIIRASDVCLVLLRAADNFKTVIPTKMLEFMACGRAVIVGVDGQAREIVETAAGGIFIEPDDAVALASAIERLISDPELRERLGDNGRAYMVENLSREGTARAYLEVLRELVEAKA